MDALSYDARRTIHEYVRNHPGSHLREIARVLHLPLGTALYHLDYLTTREHLVVRRDGRYKRFFVRHTLGRWEMGHVSAFRHDVPRRVARALLERSPRTQRDLARVAGVSRSTLSFHITRMVQDGLVQCETRRPENHYRLAEPEVAHRVLEQFGASFGDAPLPVAPIVSATPAEEAAEVTP